MSELQGVCFCRLAVENQMGVVVIFHLQNLFPLLCGQKFSKPKIPTKLWSFFSTFENDHSCTIKGRLPSLTTVNEGSLPCSPTIDMKKRSLLAKLPQNLSIREQLGISQEQYADFCGISKSMLSMIEIGKRNWPGGSPNDSEILLAFGQASKEPPDTSAFEIAQPTEKKNLEHRFRKLKVEKDRAVIVLEAMTFGYTQAQLRLKVCLLLREKFPDETTEGKLIGLWQHKARIKLRKASPMVQELLQLQIDNLEKKMEAVERRMKVV